MVNKEGEKCPPLKELVAKKGGGGSGGGKDNPDKGPDKRRNSLSEESNGSSSSSSSRDSDESSSNQSLENNKGTMTTDFDEEQDEFERNSENVEKEREKMEQARRNSEQIAKLALEKFRKISELEKHGESPKRAPLSRWEQLSEEQIKEEQERRQLTLSYLRQEVIKQQNQQKTSTAGAGCPISTNSAVYNSNGSMTFHNKPKVHPSAKIGIERLQGNVGFGVAASGYYDKSPKIHEARINGGSLQQTYSDLVGNYKENWRSQYLAELKNSKVREDSNKASSSNSSSTNYYRNMDVFLQIKKVEMQADKQSNLWLRSLLWLVLDGKAKKALKRLERVEAVLMKRDRTFAKMGRQQRYEVISEALFSLYSNDTGTSLLMYLVSGVRPQLKAVGDVRPCFKRHHGDCLLADLLLSMSHPKKRAAYIGERDPEHGHAPVHLAAMSGYLCQMDILMRYGADTEITTACGQRPIQLALKRADLLIVKQLMWQGSDLGQLMHDVQQDKCTENYGTVKFVKERVGALGRCMLAWVRYFLGPRITICCPLTQLQIVRIAKPIDVKEQRSQYHCRELNLAFPEKLNNCGTHFLLFVIPCAYTPQDACMPASTPHIVRTRLAHPPRDKDVQSTSIMKFDKLRLLPVSPSITVHGSGQRILSTTELVSALPDVHNGFYYAYWLSKETISRDDAHPRTLRLTLDTHDMDESLNTAFLMLQVYSVQPTTGKPKTD